MNILNFAITEPNPPTALKVSGGCPYKQQAGEHENVHITTLFCNLLFIAALISCHLPTTQYPFFLLPILFNTPIRF